MSLEIHVHIDTFLIRLSIDAKYALYIITKMDYFPTHVIHISKHLYQMDVDLLVNDLLTLDCFY